jgi:ABC-type uncharacterized transport system substrate-binding protein
MKKILFFLCLFATFVFANPSPPKDILLIQSYHKGYKWSDAISSVIEQNFSEKENIFLSTVYMDTKRNDTSSYLQTFYAYYKERFKHYKFDVVIVADNAALDFVREHYHELFEAIPVVFLGINNFEPSLIHNIDLVSGVVENVDIEKNIDLILANQPRLDKILIIN